MIGRRRFLTGLAASLMTPAVVRASSLEYVPRAPKLIGGVLVVNNSGVALEPGHGITYQWLRDGQPIIGATGRSYAIDSLEDRSLYSVWFSHD